MVIKEFAENTIPIKSAHILDDEQYKEKPLPPVVKPLGDVVKHHMVKARPLPRPSNFP